MSTAAPLATWRTIAHLCRHDLRRFRLLVALTTGLELLRAAYVEWTLHLAPTAIGDRFGGAGGEMETALLDFAIWATTWIVTAVVVQADHPSDDRAFWRTRPLAPHAVALAKVAFLGLIFAAMPSILNAVRLAAYGAPPSAHAAAAVQIAVQAGGAVVPAWALAILTRTMPRFLAGVGGVVVGAYLLLMASIWYMGLWSRGGIGSMSVGVSADGAGWARSETHGWILAAAIVALGLAILVAHYRLRRIWVALAAGAGLVIVPGLLPVPGDTRTSAPPPQLARLVETGPLSPASLKVDAPFVANGPRLAALDGRLELAGLPRDVSAAIFVDRVRVEVNGRDVAVDGLEQCCLGVGPIGAASILDPPPSRLPGDVRSDGLATVLGNAVAELHATPVTVDAEATVVFTRHRLVASLPLTAGAAFRGDGYVVEVLAIADRLPAILVRLTRFPQLSGTGDPQLAFFTADAARTHLGATTVPYQASARPAREGTFEWSQGRRWAMRFHAMVPFRGAVGRNERLLIVESRRDGQAPVRIAWAGRPAAPR